MPPQELKCIDDYEVLLTERMSAWSPQKRIALAAAIAERWLAAYDVFSAEEDWGDSPSLHRSLEAIWSHVQGRSLSAREVRRQVEQIEQVTPHMDDFDAEEALTACGVLVYALRSCGSLENTIPHVLGSALGVFETLVEDWPIDPASQTRVWQRKSVRSELQAQLQLIEAIDVLEKLDADAIHELRHRVVGMKFKTPAAPKPKDPIELSNQMLFEQYRRYVESDLKGQVKGQAEPEPGSYLFAIGYLGYWMGRYSRRLQTINGSYGRLADKLGQEALVTRNRGLDALDDAMPFWNQETYELIEMCLKNNSQLKTLDADSIQTPHAYGPSLRRLWLEGMRLSDSELDAWKHVRVWASHRPASWEAEDARKKRGWAQSTRELGELLAREVAWVTTKDPIHPWAAHVEGNSWQVRVNDFPDELMYSLIVGGKDTGAFHDWTETWQRRL